MLDPSTWLAQAQALKEGTRATVEHDCGDGRKMVVNHKTDCWSAWCYRCSEKGWVPKPREGLTQRLDRLKAMRAAEEAVAREIKPPMPANFDPSTWPLKDRVWLYKAGLSNERIQSLGFYYCERIKRVVMPVFSNGRLVYWQARTQDPDLPKYLNPPVDKPVFKQGSGRVLVLTEDMLSAARVGEVTEAWCIMGTSLTDTVITELLMSKRPIKVWLDGDSAGEKGMRKFVPQLRNFGIDAVAIRTDRDPKFHSKQEIEDQLRPDPPPHP